MRANRAQPDERGGAHGFYVLCFVPGIDCAYAVYRYFNFSLMSIGLYIRVLDSYCHSRDIIYNYLLPSPLIFMKDHNFGCYHAQHLLRRVEQLIWGIVI